MSAAAPTLSASGRASAAFMRIDESHPGVERVHADPPVFRVAGFLSPDECARVLAAGLPGLARSIVVDGAAGKSPAPSRTSESACAAASAAVVALGLAREKRVVRL
jgi:hypothetical protein